MEFAKHIVLFHYQKNKPLLEALEGTYGFLNIFFHRDKIEKLIQAMQKQDMEYLEREGKTEDGKIFTAVLNFIEGAKNAIARYGNMHYEDEVEAVKGYLPHGKKYLRSKGVLPQKKWFQFWK